jgi:hypothetical protein
MLKRNGQLLAFLVVCVVVAGCSVRLGGAKPEEYNAIGLRAAAGAGAGEVAARIRGAEGDVVLLAADRDSVWFADVATQSGLMLSGPGRTGPSSLGLLTRLEVLGDTALILNVPNGGGRLHMQDALFKVDKDRTLDLMLVSFAEASSVREGVRALLNYIATDVGGTAAVVIGIDAPARATADSAAVLIRAAFTSAQDCDGPKVDVPADGVSLNLFYGPEARLSCTSARILPGTPNAIMARVVVER